MKNSFRNISTGTINSIFKKYGIQIDRDYQFSDINLVIGANGSGKTRFLKAIRELYSMDNNLEILYGYFPALADNIEKIGKEKGDLPEYTLFESMSLSTSYFIDFFKEIETQNQSFIPGLLRFQSKRQKARGENTLRIISECFFELTNKNLIITPDSVVCLSNKDKQPLSAALKDLSPGELILFYMSIFLAVQQAGEKNKIII